VWKRVDAQLWPNGVLDADIAGIGAAGEPDASSSILPVADAGRGSKGMAPLDGKAAAEATTAAVPPASAAAAGGGKKRREVKKRKKPTGAEEVDVDAGSGQ